MDDSELVVGANVDDVVASATFVGSDNAFLPFDDFRNPRFVLADQVVRIT